MFVGPFFYFEEAVAGQGGIYAALVALEKSEQIADKLGASLSHQELFDRLNTDIDYINIPRGRVVYDTVKKEAVIYIDRCIETRIKEIIKAFEIDKFRIEYDEHYVCPGCWDLDAMWQ
ncbi:MAG: hypothetical protein SCM11_04390 [Bacillota bacterium]|nr:hypothetical protein [Bacillota bacterium]